MKGDVINTKHHQIIKISLKHCLFASKELPALQLTLAEIGLQRQSAETLGRLQQGEACQNALGEGQQVGAEEQGTGSGARSQATKPSSRSKP